MQLSDVVQTHVVFGAGSSPAFTCMVRRDGPI